MCVPFVSAHLSARALRDESRGIPVSLIYIFSSHFILFLPSYRSYLELFPGISFARIPKMCFCLAAPVNVLPTLTMIKGVQSALVGISVSDVDNDVTQVELRSSGCKLIYNKGSEASHVSMPLTGTGALAVDNLEYKCAAELAESTDTVTVTSRDSESGETTTKMTITLKSKLIFTILSKKAPSNWFNPPKATFHKEPTFCDLYVVEITPFTQCMLLFEVGRN